MTISINTKEIFLMSIKKTTETDNRPNDPHSRPGTADSDTLSLLRDLRSLRDASHTPVTKQVTEQNPPIGPNRHVGMAIALILLVVGLGVHSVMNNPTEPSLSSSPFPKSSVSISVNKNVSASVKEIWLRYTLCQWLLKYYDTHAPVSLRFCLFSDAEIIPVSHGPALMFGRHRLANEDELALVEKSLELKSGTTRKEYCIR
jgi:hypothetical protein